MAKTKISEFSATPANNTDIDSINIAEGCAPSGINDAIRELMAQLKDFQTGAVGDSFNGPIGTSTAAAGAFTTLSASSTATLSGLTASTALALDASKNIVSVTNTGTGSNVLATSPTLVTPILGTPTSVTLTNATGLPIATGVSGLGTGVATFLATPSSANLRSALTDETGTGSAVFATSPTLVTPVLGTPTSGTLTNCTGLPNAGLVNSSITIGGTAIALGASSNALANDITVNGLTVGRGAGAVSTNTAVGASALAANTTGFFSTAVGFEAGSTANAEGITVVGYRAGKAIGVNAYFSTFVGEQSGLVTTEAGNTGIGALTLLANTSGANNFAGGREVLKANTTGSSNTAVGGYNTMVSNTTGSNNTAVGRQALQANTTASNNTAVGYQAAYSNQTGTNITAVGQGAAYSSTSSTYGICAIGVNSALDTTTGTVVAIGTVSVMRANTTGNYNIAIGGPAATGYATMRYNTTGSNNTAIGFESLAFNTTASYNTAVGYQAAYSSTGAETSAFGYQALWQTTGASNTAFGSLAGGSVTTGSKNAFFGYNSGYYVTTGSKNTIIGAYNGNQGGLDIRTASNYIVLSDGDGNPRLWHDGSGTLTLKPNAATTNIGYGFDNAELYPFPDNNQSLGLSSFRWTTVYATTALINTSDANLKQQIRSLDVAEKNVAQAIKGLIKAYKFNDAVAKKGDGARIHIGAIAQEVQAAFVAEGLDPNRYAMFCSDTWYEVDGKASETAIEPFTAETPNAVEVTRLGLRYEELLAFVISTL